MQPLDLCNLEDLQKLDPFVAAPVAISEVLEDGSSPTLPSRELSQLGDIAPAPAHEDGEHDGVSIRNVVRFFDTQMSQFLCISTYAVLDTMELAKSFALLFETNRSNTVRVMLLAVTSRESETNELVRGDLTSQKRTRHTCADAYCTTRYCIRGKGVGRAAFFAIVQMHSRTCNRFGKMVASSERFQIDDGGAKAHGKGTLTVQSVVALAFLKRYGKMKLYRALSTEVLLKKTL
ncbi:hypothetical protein BWQ96_00648 [Gracilariopsis chorda]|uniref:Uncharacterized protein n=1 Tax=Gracilariopsis chorda TaxID=448386 RepID=A0A2V3J568_9FLOR|nr:hypothetical protein BWQ96_00648 [Gracilariopsis chorda]|eukprot:PXF49578.1 hypothetical protein BWQ96_00648 [Gracilariopsis chorda]